MNETKTNSATTSTVDPNLKLQFIPHDDRYQWKAAVMATLNVLFAVLSVNVILLVAVIGSIVLAVIAATTPDPWRLAAVAAYAIIVVVPLTWLASRK